MIKMTMKPPLTPLLAGVFALALTTSAQNVAGTLPPAATQTGVTYSTDIKPILDKSCAKCHSGDKPKARLHLDTLAGILKGSRNGKVVIVGDSAKSLLVQAAGHVAEDHDIWMPPDKDTDKFPTLTAAQISLLRAWIDQGAK
jgi:hypothetical protein